MCHPIARYLRRIVICCHLFGCASVGRVDDLGPVDDTEEGCEGGHGSEDWQHLYELDHLNKIEIVLPK